MACPPGLLLTNLHITHRPGSRLKYTPYAPLLVPYQKFYTYSTGRGYIDSGLFGQICRKSAVPSNIVGTAVPTNLSEQTNIYNSAPRAPVRSCLTCWISSGRDSVMEQLSAHHINKQTYDCSQHSRQEQINLAIPEPIQYRLWGNEILILVM